VKSSVRFKSLNFLTKKSIDLNRDWNQWFKSHWFKSANPGTRPAVTPAIQDGTRFTYPGGMEGWVDLGAGYILRWFTCPQTVTHPSTNHLIATRPGVEPTTSRSQVQRPNRYTTKPLSTSSLSLYTKTGDVIMFCVSGDGWFADLDQKPKPVI